MNEFLEAADGYVPLIQSLIWPTFLLILMAIFRKHVAELFHGLKHRIHSGAEFKVAGLEVGKLVTKTSDLPDEVKTYGDPDQLKLLFKAQGKGWKKSTKALQLPGGCLIQVTTERQSTDGDWANAEAVEFIPNVKLEQTENSFFRLVEK
ncbi:MAG: hypothetical protein ACPGSM_13785 [Thiolinea sp.]